MENIESVQKSIKGILEKERAILEIYEILNKELLSASWKRKFSDMDRENLEDMVALLERDSGRHIKNLNFINKNLGGDFSKLTM